VTQAPRCASVFSLCGCGLTNRCEKGCEKKSFVNLVSTTGKVLGKRLSEYFAFQKVFLALIAVAGVARLGLSLAGVPDGTAKWFSLTVVAAASIFYYGTAAHMRSFGGHK